jgi:hypothetical protein
MRLFASFLLLAAAAGAQQGDALLQVKRIYVEPLDGGTAAVGFRDLIIAGLNATKLFVLTDNPERADAVLKGAASDREFTDALDSSENVSTHEGAGKYSSGKAALSVGGGLNASSGAAGGESHHLRDHKHEAYATLRLCNKDGDVIWSTTQESDGAKFRSARSDVATKVARQLQLDVEREVSRSRP